MATLIFEAPRRLPHFSTLKQTLDLFTLATLSSASPSCREGVATLVFEAPQRLPHFSTPKQKLDLALSALHLTVPDFLLRPS